MIIFKELKKRVYFSAFSGWIENFGVVPLLLLRAFLLLPAFVFLLALLFLVTRVLETIFQLLSVPHIFFGKNQVTNRATRCPRHNFINLEFLRPSQFLVKNILIIMIISPMLQSATVKGETGFQRVTPRTQAVSNTNALIDLSLAKGELLRLPFKGAIKRFSVGNKEVLRVKSLGTKVMLLKAMKIGHSDLLIWSKSSPRPQKYSVFVVRKSQQLKLMQIAHTLTSLGLNISRQAGLVKLSGELKSLQSYKELVSRIGQFQDKIDLEYVSLSNKTKRKVFSQLLIKISQFNLTEINCSPLKLYIRCEAAKELQEKLKGLKKDFLIQWVPQGLLQATRQYQVTLLLQQFENSRGDAFNFGLSKIEGNLSSLIFNNPLALIERNSISIKKSSFRSQTLAHPIIKGRFKIPMKVRIGQQIPFLQSVSNGVATQQWRFAGLAMDLTLNPYSQRIKVKYKTNLSRPQEGGISQNLQESELLIPIGETKVLFDIGFRVNQRDISGLPGLSRIPLFGSLFSGDSNHKTYKKILCLIKIEEIK